MSIVFGIIFGILGACYLISDWTVEDKPSSLTAVGFFIASVMCFK